LNNSPATAPKFDVPIKCTRTCTPIILYTTRALVSTFNWYINVLQGEATTAPLASRQAVFMGVGSFDLEGDALPVLLAINSPAIFAFWNFVGIVSDISLESSSFQNYNALKVSQCANYQAHALAKWATSHHVFGSIPIRSPILSSFRIKSGKDPPL
jgi:hypothetical protein